MRYTWIVLGFWGAVTTSATHALAFNSVTHVELTRSALEYLGSAGNRWSSVLNGTDSIIARETLFRAVVDADYRSEVYLSTWFHKPFAGAATSETTSIFTRIFHFMNATEKGRYWEHDGYSFQKSTQQGYDRYLGWPGVVTRGDLSIPLGGKDAAHPIHGVEIGVYNLGFKGNLRDWHRMFLEKKKATKTVFPPADVPAQMAYDAMLRSPRAQVTGVESWQEVTTVADGIFSNKKISRHHWRGEIKGLPQGFDLLGMSLHMAQDLAVPQHAQSTADNCHQEIEALTDRLACNTARDIDSRPYDDGSYSGDDHHCQTLYDPTLVTAIIAANPELDVEKKFSIRDRITATAVLSARWQWGEPDDSIDFMGTVLPDGQRFTADHCGELMTIEAVKKQVKYQYNLAVAASAAVFARAAYEYEVAHLEPPRQLGDRIAEFFSEL